MKQPQAELYATLPTYCNKRVHEIAVDFAGKCSFLSHENDPPSDCGCVKVQKVVEDYFKMHRPTEPLKLDEQPISEFVRRLCSDVPYFWAVFNRQLTTVL